MTISLVIDGVLLALLLAALAYGVVLGRRIARLQAALIDLAPALQAFCDAVDQSERSVGEIRRETDRLEAGRLEAQTAQALQSSGAEPGRIAPPRAKSERGDLVRNFFATARMKVL